MSTILLQRPFRVRDLVRRILLAWLAAVLLEYLLLPQNLQDLGKLDGLRQMSMIRIVGITLAGAAGLWVLSRFLPTVPWERIGLAAVFGILAFSVLLTNFTWPFFTVCLLILAVLAVYARFGWDKSVPKQAPPAAERKRYLWITGGLALGFFLFVSAWTAGRVFSLGTPTYDFGLFAQMFYHMKETGLPMTTLERDGLLSHFAVHVSPIYYLMLPVYWLIPHPATLQVLQAAVLASAVIPLWKLGKHHGLTSLQRTLLCAVLLLHPAVAGGTSYDLHENCFLLPLILWLFYGIDRKSIPITTAAALLTLGVKEDAAVYVAVIALWLLVKTLLRFPKHSKQDLITGGVLLCAALGWFFLVTGYLANQGDGVMTGRYQNFMYDGSGSLVTVVKSVLLNPMKAVFECVDAEKLEYIALTLVPLLGLPLLTRRYERYLLLIPYVLVNLMSDYTYQHSVMFQYSFGSMACLIYLTAVNLADLKVPKIRVLPLVLSVVLSFGLFCGVIIPAAVPYVTRSIRSAAYYQSVHQFLSQIPEEASVAATCYYTTPLSQRRTIYDVRYCTQQHLLESEYVVVEVNSGECKKYATPGKNDGYERFIALLERNGYTLFDQMDGALLIYHRA